jgi:hypothetical protein
VPEFAGAVRFVDSSEAEAEAEPQVLYRTSGSFEGYRGFMLIKTLNSRMVLGKAMGETKRRFANL